MDIDVEGGEVIAGWGTGLRPALAWHSAKIVLISPTDCERTIYPTRRRDCQYSPGNSRLFCLRSSNVGVCCGFGNRPCSSPPRTRPRLLLLLHWSYSEKKSRQPRKNPDPVRK